MVKNRPIRQSAQLTKNLFIKTKKFSPITKIIYTYIHIILYIYIYIICNIYSMLIGPI